MEMRNLKERKMMLMNSKFKSIGFEEIDANVLNRMDFAFIQENNNLTRVKSNNRLIPLKKVINDFQKGKSPSKMLIKEKGSIPFICVENMSSESINIDSVSKYTEELISNLPKIKGEKLLTIVDGSGIGRTNIYTQEIESHYIESLAQIDVNEQILDKNYYLMFTKSPFYKNQVRGFGTFLAVPHLPYDNIKQMRIPLPPIEEQRRTLPLVKEKIARLEEKVKQLEKEKEKNSLQNTINRVFEDFFNIEIKPNHLQTSFMIKDFNDIHDNFGNLSYGYFEKNSYYQKLLYSNTISLKKILKEALLGTDDDGSQEYSEGSYKLITIKNITKFKIKDEFNRFLKNNSRKNTILTEKDKNAIIGPNVRNVGDFALIEPKYCDGSYSFTRNLIKMIPDDSYDYKFLCYYLNSYLIKVQLLMFMNGGDSGYVSLPNFLKIRVPLVNIKEQRILVEKIEKMSDQKKYELEIKTLKNKIASDLNKYILEGYSDDLFELEDSSL